MLPRINDEIVRLTEYCLLDEENYSTLIIKVLKIIKKEKLNYALYACQKLMQDKIQMRFLMPI